MWNVDTQTCTFFLLFLNDNFLRAIRKLNRRYFAASTVSYTKTIIKHVRKPGKFWLFLTICSHKFLHYVPLASIIIIIIIVMCICVLFLTLVQTLIFKKLRRTLWYVLEPAKQIWKRSCCVWKQSLHVVLATFEAVSNGMSAVPLENFSV